MTEAERKNTLRVLAKRNKSRLEALKAREAESGAGTTAQQETTATSEPPNVTSEPVVENVRHDEL